MRIIAVPDSVVSRRQELEDLRLDRHVERGRGLVGDHQTRLEGERHRDHHALAHATGELVREALRRPLGAAGCPTIVQQLDRALAGVLLGRLLVGLDRLDQLLLDGQDRVQAGQRVLEDHRDLVAADVAQVALGQRDEVEAVEHHAAALDRARPASAGGRCSARLVTLLPQPDSPTSPSVSPGASSKLTPFTA